MIGMFLGFLLLFTFYDVYFCFFLFSEVPFSIPLHSVLCLSVWRIYIAMAYGHLNLISLYPSLCPVDLLCRALLCSNHRRRRRRRPSSCCRCCCGGGYCCCGGGHCCGFHRCSCCCARCCCSEKMGLIMLWSCCGAFMRMLCKEKEPPLKRIYKFLKKIQSHLDLSLGLGLGLPGLIHTYISKFQARESLKCMSQ